MADRAQSATALWEAGGLQRRSFHTKDAARFESLLRTSPMIGLFRLFLLAALLASLACARAADAPAAPTKEEGLKAAQQVHDIFEAKCIDCHGPELPRPKGKFGYVLDLKRVAANEEWVIRGKPADSELFSMVLHNEMPGEDANVPPLTPQELDAVKHWIELGAPGELPASKDAEAATAAVLAVEQGKPDEPLWRHGLRWLGQFHPLSTHFPVALMLVAVFAEGLGWLTRREAWMHTVRFLVIIAALGAVAATGLGWVNAAFSSYNKAPGALLWWHRWLGTGTGAWAVVCATLALWGPCAEGSPERQRFRGALLVGALLVGVSGFLGSALIYGLDHYAWN